MVLIVVNHNIYDMMNHLIINDLDNVLMSLTCLVVGHLVMQESSCGMSVSSFLCNIWYIWIFVHANYRLTNYLI